MSHLDSATNNNKDKYQNEGGQVGEKTTLNKPLYSKTEATKLQLYDSFLSLSTPMFLQITVKNLR